MLKSATIFLMADAVTQAVFRDDNLAERLSNRPIGDPGTTSWGRSGFSKPSYFGEELVHTINPTLKAFKFEARDRLLPRSVINKKLDERVEDFKNRTNDKLSRRAKMQLRDEVIEKLLPKALIQSTNVPVLVVGNYLVIGTTSTATVERVLSAIHDVATHRDYEPFPLKLRRVTNIPVEDSLTSHFRQNWSRLTDNLAADQGATLSYNGGQIKLTDVDLDAETIESLLVESDYKVKDVKVVLSDDIEGAVATFTLTNKLQIKSIKYATPLTRESELDASNFSGDLVVVGGAIKAIVKSLSTLFKDQIEHDHLAQDALEQGKAEDDAAMKAMEDASAEDGHESDNQADDEDDENGGI